MHEPVNGQLSRCTVHLRGIPLGTLWLADGDLVFATLEPTAAYDAVEAELRAAATRLWIQGFMHPEPRRNRISVDALAPLPPTIFELRDEGGAALAAELVNVVPSPRSGEPPVVIVGRKLMNAAVASVARPTPRSPGEDQSANA